MFFHCRTVQGLAIYSYIVGDEHTRKCAIIDPVRDVEEYVEIANENGLDIRYILETHVHADFVSGSQELKRALKGKANIYCSGLGGEAWIPSYADHVVKDGEQVEVGNLMFKAIHSPGHTPEHIMWQLSENGALLKLFTGDFLLVGAVGRPDLLGKEEEEKLAHQLYHTTFEKLDQFPDIVEVRPAHGAGSLCGKALGSSPYSIMGEERSRNPYLKKRPEKEWIQALMDGMPPAPQYFARMKKVNVEGAQPIDSVVEKVGPLSVEEVREEVRKDAVVLDVRGKEAFAARHIPGSINIPIGSKISTWAGWVLPYPNPIVLVVEEEGDLDQVLKQLLRVGYDQVAGFLNGGIEAWEKAGLEMASFSVLSVEELSQQLESSFVLDVRTKEEWDQGHIKGAHLLHGGLLPDHTGQVPKEEPVAIMCGSGFRASIAASILMRAGYKNVFNVGGGMQAWRDKGYPIETLSV